MTITEIRDDIFIERVTGNVGALVSGIGLESSGPNVQARLRGALHEHGVLFFECEHVLSSAEFMTFGKLFGEPEAHYRLKLAGQEQGPGYIDSDLAPMKEVRINVWHSDGTAFECPPQAAMLTPVELPEVGGDTMWASMYAAHETLSPPIQKMLDELEVLHSAARLPFLNLKPTAVHPAVIRDPVTGRKMLFVNGNYSERILGMNDAESEALLQMLFRHVNTPEFHVRLRWRPGVVAVREERVTQHRGVADFTGPRKLRRLTFQGERPSR
jgi:taurine dioxygenase